jgi:hypothetical protein
MISMQPIQIFVQERYKPATCGSVVRRERMLFSAEQIIAMAKRAIRKYLNTSINTQKQLLF